MPLSKLPRWVWAGGFVLAWIAGMVNVTGLLGFEHQAVTHLTGSTTMLGDAVARGDGDAVLHLLAVLGAFVAGTVVSGFVIQDSVLTIGRRYGVTLLLEAVLLGVAVPLLEAGRSGGVYLASAACGLQNAMATTYSGAVVRTTHVTGMFTDLGIAVGHAVRGVPVDGRRLRVCVTIVSGFLCGAVAGAFAFRALGYPALWIPAGLVGGAGLVYVAWTTRRIGRGRPG
jgi:uncharacterized membrane protein YoaK (UPF0700 family)